MPPVKLNLLDRVVGYVSPARAMDRLRARAGLGFLFGLDGGGYDAGKSDKKALQRYNPLVRSARGDVHPGLDKMRARSRDQVRNNPLAAGALNTTVTSTVGAGLTCQPHIDQDVLGLSDEQADAWEKQALRWWNLWSETTECDIESELTFGQLQSLAFRAVLESGDVLRIRRFLWDPATTRPSRGDAFGTKLQLVEADRVSNPDYKPDTERVSGGVEIDADGRPIGYWVGSRVGTGFHLESGLNPSVSPGCADRRAALRRCADRDGLAGLERARPRIRAHGNGLHGAAGLGRRAADRPVCRPAARRCRSGRRSRRTPQRRHRRPLQG